MSRKGKKGKRQNQQNVIQQSLSTSDQQKLSTKFQNLFDKQVLSEYENDNYRECIKQCDRILVIYPKNGETLAMKGLCLHCQGAMAEDEDKEDGKENESKSDGGMARRERLRKHGLLLIQQGLKCNLKSSICWRVKGLAHKSDKDFEAAIVCYKKASFYDKQNHRIYTDLASLQIQLKRFDEFAKTRKEIYYITGKQDKLNCIAFVIALFLNKDYAKCLEIMDEELRHIELNKIEWNEIYLLQTKILLKQEKYDKALAHLNQKLQTNLIVDKLSGLQLKVDILLKLNRFDAAIDAVLLLIEKNPENLNYHKQYIHLLGNDEKLIFETYLTMTAKFPKCNIIGRLLLSQCPESSKKEFCELLSAYLILKFQKSVPSLYRDIQELYLCEWKAIIIDGLVAEYRVNMNGSPMCKLWVNYFYCSRLIDLYQFAEALSVIDGMLLMVPTCIELYLLKSRLYKCAGNGLLAFKYLDYGRRLDLADRYLNTLCVRYAFGCGRHSAAEEMVSLFLKKTDGSKALNNLQVIWYQLHKAEAHLELLQYGPAIKQYQNVFNHFETFWKNQTDFHRYSYRKCAINSYTQLLEWEYTLRNHPFFMRAARKALFLWLKMYKLQSQNEVNGLRELKELECGSWPYDEMDKKKHRQKDERGWKLIHCKASHSLSKLKEWLNYLLPLVENNIIPDDNIDIIYILMAYIKYLLYMNETKLMFEILHKVKEKYSKLLIEPYYIYNIFIFIFQDLPLHKPLNENYEKEFNELSQEYNVNFLKAYYEKYVGDFDKIWCVLKCCLQIDQIYLDIGYSTNDIINEMVKLGCNPLKCVEIRKELKKYDNKLLLQTFEKYVEMTYPLQLNKENELSTD